MDKQIVISGISGKFPLSDNMNSFRENLFNKVDMVTSGKRWELHHPEMPERIGKINNIEKLDAGFFGIHRREADIMEPMYRGMMEKVFEAIYDAGVNPKELEGSKTGVYIAVTISDNQGQMFNHDVRSDRFTFMGLIRAVLPNRISYTLKVNGPSVVVDTGCSSSLVALNEAYKDMRSEKIQTAIVGAAVVHLHPMITLQFANFGALSPDGICKTFDENANGYARSEAIAAVLLQRFQHARRVYSKVIHCRASNDGFKDKGIVHSSSDEQEQQLSDFYKECGINPTSIDYVEAHGTGTNVGDFEELTSLSKTFCKNRKLQLLLGSVKSNMGHAEAAAGLCQIAKATIIMENALIPPNLHFKTPRKGVDSLKEGKIQVVCETKPFSLGLLAINSLGVGGSNAHTLLKWNDKSRFGAERQEEETLRLICVSGRVKESVEAILQQLESLDVEFEALLHQVFKYDIPQHSYRGFAVIDKSGQIYRSVKKKNLTSNPDFCLTFGNPHITFGKQLSEVLELSVARKIFQKIKLALSQQHLQTSEDVSAVLTTVSMQIIVFEILKLCKLIPKNIISVGYGKLVESFALGLLSLEETVSAVYFESINGNEIGNKQDVTEDVTGVTIHISADGIPIFSSNNQENFLFSLLKAIGRLYEHGCNPQVYEIYPKINFPVSRGTPMISPLIHWNHEADYFVPYYTRLTQKSGSFEKVFTVDVNDSKWKFIVDHVLDGDERNFFPGAGYLYIVWVAYAAMKEELPEEIIVNFENVRFTRATSIPKGGKLEFYVSIRRGSGYFEVLESKACVVNGRVTNGNSHNSDINFTAEPLAQNVVQEKDIYKEMRVRGYRYSGLFKSIKSCTSDFNRAEVQWHKNWITFIDNMLQLKTFHSPRALYVVTFIQQVIINASYHLSFANKWKHSLLPVYYHRTPEIIKSGGIEIRGIHTSAITRRKPLKEPVLEKHVFVPNEGTFSLDDAVRINVQLILENTFRIKVKFAELEQDGSQNLTPLILQALSDQILIQAEALMVRNNQKTKLNDCLFIVGYNLLKDKNVLKDFVTTDNFVLSREPLNYTFDNECMEILSAYTTPAETLVLLRKRIAWKLPNIVQLKDLQWIQELQTLKQTGKETLVFSQSDPINGILGFVNCIRREPGGETIKGLFIQDDVAPAVDLNLEFYQKQLRKGLAINVFKNGQWGTYKHLLLRPELVAEKQHALVKQLSKGNLSSLKWVEGPLTTEEGCISVYYAALNFKDVMRACGRIQYTTSSELYERDSLLGLEYSGRTASGKRVMGILAGGGAISTLVKPDEDLLLPVPNEWSLEEAATVPFAYSTALYALVKVANIKKGQSILIHAGAGGIGQAAINIAFHYGLKIYTTVGSEEKKTFLLNNYPFLKEHLISSSRSTDFEQMVMTETGGRGVDVVLNSLTKEKLEASLRCLAKRGKFLEIGNFDLFNVNNLWLECFKHEVSFHSIDLERLWYSDSQNKKYLMGLLETAIKEGAVKPLSRTLFETDKVEEAFRFMTNGHHVSKVIIKIKNDNNISTAIVASGQYYCKPDGCCIVTGGLGGIGLELVDWLIKRGGRKFILSSRSGVKDGYQASRIKMWMEEGIEIRISTHNITTKAGSKKLLEEANLLGPVTSIFHLAVVLSMALFEDQTEDTFKVCLDPKSEAAKHLDTLSRSLCPNLRDFVVFSSFCCGRGAAGHTSYGMANSIMERMIEERKKLGLPALAIQWGMIEDVGIAAEMHSRSTPLEVFGTQQQSISSCWQVLDRFLKDKEVAVVSSIVMAERKNAFGRADNIVEAVANIIGVRDLKTVSMHATLPEMGMDSLLAIEIRQVMEKEFDIVFSENEVRSLTFARLHEIMNKKSPDDLQAKKNARSLDHYEVLRTPSCVEASEGGRSVYLLSEVEGALESLAKNLPFHCFRLLFRRRSLKEADVADIATKLLNLVEDKILKVGTFDFIAKSFGCLVALEMTARLEKRGVQGKVILIHDVPKATQELSHPSTEEAGSDLLFSFIQNKDGNNSHKSFSSRIVLCKPNGENFAGAGEDNVSVCRFDEEHLNSGLFKVVTEELC